MRDETFFQATLRHDLDDAAARLLFADWLADRGDDRASGYRFMAERAKHPYRGHNTFEWWTMASANSDAIKLSDELWQALPVTPANGYPDCKEFRTRRRAEEALCALVTPARK